MVQKNSVKPKIIIVIGPTASGKTSLGIFLAKNLDGEIISADSMQVYKGMDIGTAKITQEEMQGIPHHLLDVVHPTENYSVSLWKEAAEKAIEDIIKRGKTPIIVGGTGLYITSLIKGYNFYEATEDTQYRAQLETLLKEKGPEYLHGMLKEKNEKLAESVHPNKTKAIIRYLEVLKSNPSYNIENQEEKYDYLLFGLDIDRELLYNRINKRVDIMVENGLEEELKTLLKNGTSKTSLGAIGYKEMLGYLDGTSTFSECTQLIKQRSRNYAKRQLTYIRGMDNVTHIKYNDIDLALKLSKEFLNKE